MSTEPKRTHFVWDGSRLLQEYTYKGSYTYIYTDQDSYEPLAQVFDNAKDGKQYIAYFHNDQVGIPREMTDIHGNLLWYGEYTAWGRLKKMSGFTRMRTSRLDCKTSMPTVKLDCITT